jgi:hypothetical protein
MALNWDMTKVYDTEALHESDYEWAISEVIIFGSMGVDLGSITEENLDEWTYRITLYQKLNGALLRIDGKPFYVTRAHLERRIGLKVNVCNMTRAKWRNKMFDNVHIREIENQFIHSNELLSEKFKDAK